MTRKTFFQTLLAAPVAVVAAPLRPIDPESSAPKVWEWVQPDEWRWLARRPGAHFGLCIEENLAGRLYDCSILLRNGLRTKEFNIAPGGMRFPTLAQVKGALEEIGNAL